MSSHLGSEEQIRKIFNTYERTGDPLAFLTGTLVTGSTVEPLIEGFNKLQQAKSSASKDDMVGFSSHVMDQHVSSSPGKLVQCRICHDEDEDSNLEIPCSCCGSLKYAHRKCVQRWCNEKGDTTCEICLQQFRPDYSLRGNWEVSRRDLQNPGEMVTTTDQDFLEPNLDDFALSSRSLLCCRVVIIIFMVLLVMRHTLPAIISGPGDYSLTLFTLLMLRTIGILLPIYIMLKAFTAIQRRRHQQDPRFAVASSGEENQLPQLRQPPSRFIGIR